MIYFFKIFFLSCFIADENSIIQFDLTVVIDFIGMKKNSVLNNLLGHILWFDLFYVYVCVCVYE